MEVSSRSIGFTPEGLADLEGWQAFGAVLQAQQAARDAMTLEQKAALAEYYRRQGYLFRRARKRQARVVAVIRSRRVGTVRPRERRDGSRRHSTRGSTDDDAGGSEPPGAAPVYPRPIAGANR